MTSMRALFVAVPLSLLIACGGRSEDDDGTGGSSGSAGSAASSGDAGSAGSKGGSAGTGGSNRGGTGSGGKGGSVGGSSSGGGPSTGGTGAIGGDGGTAGTTPNGGVSGTSGGCCLALPTCAPGQVEQPVDKPCPPGYECEDISICCSTIRCGSPIATCSAYPSCDEGDTQVEGECPPDGACYTSSLCGSTINCRDTGCDPESEHNLNYVGMGDSCALLDFACPEHTNYFHNDCGCGCEQDRSCPAVIDCSPSPEPNPRCSQEKLERCPYTVIAL